MPAEKAKPAKQAPPKQPQQKAAPTSTATSQKGTVWQVGLDQNLTSRARSGRADHIERKAARANTFNRLPCDIAQTLREGGEGGGSRKGVWSLTKNKLPVVLAIMFVIIIFCVLGTITSISIITVQKFKLKPA